MIELHYHFINCFRWSPNYLSLLQILFQLECVLFILLAPELTDFALNFVAGAKGLRVRQDFETLFVNMSRPEDFEDEFQSSTSSQEVFDLPSQPNVGQPEHNCKLTFFSLFTEWIILHYQRVQSQLVISKTCSEYNSSWSNFFLLKILLRVLSTKWFVARGDDEFW